MESVYHMWRLFFNKSMILFWNVYYFRTISLSFSFDFFPHNFHIYHYFTKRLFRIYTVDNVDNSVYKSKTPISRRFVMWMTSAPLSSGYFLFPQNQRIHLWTLHKHRFVNHFFDKKRIQTFCFSAAEKNRRGLASPEIFKRFFWWKEWNGSLRWIR